ncbi:hypothetical protein AX15_003836 [Amanita polypyramis BW_CC]|nr:hypothetical protein AX15_003836 [Amanita polypyramis BW_CC]
MIINELSSELLGHIFTLCCPQPLYIPRQGQIRRPPQLDISQVCSWWRQVALGTTDLWNNVVVDNTSDKCMAIVREWLSRAGNSRIAFNSHEWGVPLIPFLAPFRLRSLNLNLNSEGASALQLLPENTLSGLEWLCLNIFDEGVQLRLTDTQCPMLRTVILSAPRHKDITLPWDQLKYLSVKRVSVEFCWDVLRQCRSLNECDILTHYDVDTPPVYTGTPFSVPNLQTLCIPFSLFLEPMILPRLHSLAISNILPPWTRSNPLSTVNAPILRRLDIGQVSTTIAGFNGIELLEFIPSARSVVISTIKLSQTDRERLSTGELGPNLQMIALLQRQNANDILTMVEKRLDHANSDSHVMPFTVVVLVPSEYQKCKGRIELLKERGVKMYTLEYGSRGDLYLVTGGLFKM